MRPSKEKVSITLDDNIIVEIRTLAEEDDRSFSQYINMILRSHLKDVNKNESENSEKNS